MPPGTPEFPAEKRNSQSLRLPVPGLMSTGNTSSNTSVKYWGSCRSCSLVVRHPCNLAFRHPGGETIAERALPAILRLLSEKTVTRQERYGRVVGRVPRFGGRQNLQITHLSARPRDSNSCYIACVIFAETICRQGRAPICLQPKSRRFDGD
jgi:hypothetical protein